jgi:hypothetical protein
MGDVWRESPNRGAYQDHCQSETREPSADKTFCAHVVRLGLLICLFAVSQE